MPTFQMYYCDYSMWLFFFLNTMKTYVRYGGGGRKKVH